VRLRFSIRDLLLVTAIAAVLAAWWADHHWMEDQLRSLAPPAALVEGRVIYADSGQPAVGIRVHAQGCMSAQFHTEDAGATKTDDEGRFQFVNLTPGNYNIFADMIDGWTMIAVESLPLVSGQVVTNADVKLVKGGFIKGQVVDADTGKPVASTPEGRPIEIGVNGPARPRVGAGTQVLYVDSKGEFRIQVPAGTNYVFTMNVQPNSVADDDYLCCSHGVLVMDGETTEMKIHIKRLPTGGSGVSAPPPNGDKQP
jgi:hypothetical protein